MRRAWRFPLALLAALTVLFCLNQPILGGDMLEYTLDTVAIAHHGTPDIRLTDIAAVRKLVPQLGWAFDPLEQDMREGRKNVYPAFARGRYGDVFPIHFFGYPALAALPLRVFETVGIAPLKAFQAANYAAIFVLGLALLRFFRSAVSAGLGVLLFLGCGGVLYMNQTSPECVGAASLLAGHPQKVLVVDQVNPMPYVLGYPPPRGSPLWMGPDAPPRVANRIFDDVDVVLVPKYSTYAPTTALMLRTYHDYLQRQFPDRTESERWTILRRVPAPRTP